MSALSVDSEQMTTPALSSSSSSSPILESGSYNAAAIDLDVTFDLSPPMATAVNGYDESNPKVHLSSVSPNPVSEDVTTLEDAQPNLTLVVESPADEPSKPPSVNTNPEDVATLEDSKPKLTLVVESLTNELSKPPFVNTNPDVATLEDARPKVENLANEPSRPSSVNTNPEDVATLEDAKPKLILVVESPTTELSQPHEDFPNPHDVPVPASFYTVSHHSLSTSSLVAPEKSGLKRLPSALRPAHPRFFDSMDNRRASMSLSNLEFGIFPSPSDDGTLHFPETAASVSTRRLLSSESEISFSTRVERNYTTVGRISFTPDGSPFTSDGMLSVPSSTSTVEFGRRYSDAAASGQALALRNAHSSSLYIPPSRGFDLPGNKTGRPRGGSQSAQLSLQVPPVLRHARSSAILGTRSYAHYSPNRQPGGATGRSLWQAREARWEVHPNRLLQVPPPMRHAHSLSLPNASPYDYPYNWQFENEAGGLQDQGANNELQSNLSPQVPQGSQGTKKSRRWKFWTVKRKTKAA